MGVLWPTLCYPKIKMPQLLGYLGFFCLVYNFLLVLNSWLLILGSLLKSINSFGQKRAEYWWPCELGRGIGDFAEGQACANVSGTKDPGLCVLTACAAWPCAQRSLLPMNALVTLAPQSNSPLAAIERD